MQPGVTDTRYACNQKLGLAQEAADHKKKAEYLKAGKEPPSTSVRTGGQETLAPRSTCGRGARIRRNCEARLAA